MFKDIKRIVIKKVCFLERRRFVLKSNALVWSNEKVITDGLAVFEYGCIGFPDFRNVKIWTGNVVDHSNIQCVLYDVYELSDKF